MCQFRTNHRTTGMCGHTEVMLYRARTSLVPVSSGGGHGGGGMVGVDVEVGDIVGGTWRWGTWRGGWWGGHGGGHGGGGTYWETSLCVHV